MGKKSILATPQFAAVNVSHRLKLSRTDRQMDRDHALAVQINLCDTKRYLACASPANRGVAELFQNKNA